MVPAGANAMSDTALDRSLAVLLVALLATGHLTWRAGTPDTAWLYILHGLLAGLLLAAVAVKLRRSVPRAVAARRWRRLAVGLPLALLVLLSLTGGFLWAAGGRLIELGPWTLLGWHGIFALALLPFVLVHLLPKRWRLLRPRALLRLRANVVGGLRRGSARVQPATRRSVTVRPAVATSQIGVGASRPDATRTIPRRGLLTAAGLGLVALVVWSVAGILDVLGGRPRRFTGSRWLPAGGIPVPTTFFGEGTPAIDPASWRLRVSGAVARPKDYDLADVARLGTQDLTAILDCTGGWAMETTWQGIPMATLLDVVAPLPGARSVEVRSVTGWGAAFSLDEARRTFLATGVAGKPLPAGNGAPCRLVVPDRRGLDWVKWVAEIAVS
jgi:MFS family permease